ncbi:MAG: cbb3-type cytochrome c oxidase subunit 3 [Rhodothalassiaceae bacterium]
MYERMMHIAGTWGLGFLMVLFLVALAYALWPGNRAKFERASRVPLEDDGFEERE